MKSSRNRIDITYHNKVIYTGAINSGNYLRVVDTLFADSRKRFVVDTFGAEAEEASLDDIDLRGCYLLLTVKIMYAGIPVYYIYIAEGQKGTLKSFYDLLIKSNNIEDSWEFSIESCLDDGIIYRGDKLPLIKCADVLYKDALLRYANTAVSAEESIFRKTEIVDTDTDVLEVDVSYNKATARYKLSGPADYILELEYYFKGVYEDFEKDLRFGNIAAAYVCRSIDEISNNYDVDVTKLLWFPFKMDGNLTGECLQLSDKDEIFKKAESFCRLSVPNFGDDIRMAVEYVCNMSSMVIKHKRNGQLTFVRVSDREGFALDVSARVIVNGEHFVTYRYKVQNRMTY